MLAVADTHKRGRNRKRGGWTWVKLTEDQDFRHGVEMPVVEFAVDVKNRRTEALGNMVLRYRVTRATDKKNMVLPLYVSMVIIRYCLPCNVLMQNGLAALNSPCCG